MKKVLLTALLTLGLMLISGAAALAQGGMVHVVQWGESLSAIAYSYGVTVQAVMEANGLNNPDFVYIGQKLVVPTGGQRDHSDGGMGYEYYTVQPGDTLNTIAAQFNTSASALAIANNLGDADIIYVGQVLHVPGQAGSDSGYSPPSAPSDKPGGYHDCSNPYIVEWGDTLSAIAWHYGISVSDLSQANNLYSEIIYEGQRICVPGGGDSGPRPPQSSDYYIVKKGDTVSAIAYRFGIPVAALIKANNLSNTGLIYEGQKLVITGHASGHDGSRGHQDNSSSKPEYQDKAEAPTYVEHDQGAGGCFAPIDVWVSADQSTVKAVDTWCATSDVVNDPDGMTSLLIKTDNQTGVKIKIQRGDAVVEAVTGSPALGPDTLWYPTSPGYYMVSVADAPSEVVKIDVGPGKRGWIDFKLTSASESPRPRNTAGWSSRVASYNGGSEPANGVWSVIIVRGPAQGLPMSIRSEGSDFNAICYTGQKPEYGPGVCEFGGLWPGTYTVTLEGSGAAVQVFVDGQGTAEVVFDRQ